VWTFLQLNTQVSQGSVAIYLRQGDKFYSSFFCSSSHDARVKELLKLVHVHQSYRKNRVGVFLTHGVCPKLCSLHCNSCRFICYFLVAGDGKNNASVCRSFSRITEKVEFYCYFWRGQSWVKKQFLRSLVKKYRCSCILLLVSMDFLSYFIM